MNIHLPRLPLCAVVLVGGLIAGCASVTVDNNSIEDRTAFALGLDKSSFMVSNRVDDGVVSRYSVTTKAGKKYNCYVGGGLSILGRQVSDAICNDAPSGGASSSPAAAGASPPPCNALLKAAGRCPK